MVDRKKNEARAKVFESLLSSFRDDVVKEFQKSISSIFELPSGLWIYDKNGELEQIHSQVPSEHYPEYCKTMNSLKINTAYCSSCDIASIAYFIKHIPSHCDGTYWEVLNCPFGLGRIVFPIIIHGVAVGAFTVGKFICRGSLQVKEIEERTRSIARSQLGAQLGISDNKIGDLVDELIGKICLIPVFSDDNIKDTATNISRLVPLLTSICSHVHPTDKRFNKLIFLDNIQITDPSLLYSKEEMWGEISRVLTRICEKISLKSAVVYLSDTQNYQELRLAAYSENISRPPDTISISSENEYIALMNPKKGFVIPSNVTTLNWITSDMINKVFMTTEAIVYLRTIFAGKVILIGFGFDDKYILDEFEKHLLRESVDRLFRITHDVLSRIEIDHMMAESGHMLRRACASIKSGIDTFKRYGYYADDSQSEQKQRLREKAYIAIDSGLSRLDLIIKNYYAFESIREYRLKGDNYVDILNDFENIDVVELISKTCDIYEQDMSADEKTIKFDSCISKYEVLAQTDLLKLTFLNIIDNAVKHSYNRTYIHILLSKQGEYFQISISNRGVGIPRDEWDHVFKRYYQSRWKDPSRKREGSGYGLSIVKRSIDLMFPDGNVQIESFPWSGKKVSAKDFPGHNYITRLIIKLPFLENAE